MTVMCEDGLARPVWAATAGLMRDYYDTEWGTPVRDEQGFFARISLEAFQSGLSWATFMRKRPAFRADISRFYPEKLCYTAARSGNDCVGKWFIWWLRHPSKKKR